MTVSFAPVEGFRSMGCLFYFAQMKQASGTFAYFFRGVCLLLRTKIPVFTGFYRINTGERVLFSVEREKMSEIKKDDIVSFALLFSVKLLKY